MNKSSSISTRTAVRTIIMSIPLLLAVGIGVISMTTAQQANDILARGKAVAKSGAAVYGLTLQRGVESKRIRWEDLVTDPKYTEISFPFEVKEKRYHSTFDWFTDMAGIQYVEDSMTASDPALLYAVGNDLTGYIPTTLSKFSHPPTGDAESDAVSARSKRRFDSEMHKRAAAWTGTEPLIQEYHRDTGHMAWDVAQPIWLRDPTTQAAVHWGSFRVGVRQDRIAEVRNQMVYKLGVAFAIFEVCLAGAMYLSIKRQMVPLRRLATEADAVSRGEHDDPIAPQPGEALEINEMASSLRRLQTSLRMAMTRLPADPGPSARHPTSAVEAIR